MDRVHLVWALFLISGGDLTPPAAVAADYYGKNWLKISRY
jgi:hypothetical protein